MDLDGQWNPPESWPEASPPLPGWVRAEDGSWHGPEEPQLFSSSPFENAANPEVIDLTDSAVPATPPVPEAVRQLAPADADGPATHDGQPTDSAGVVEDAPQKPTLALEFAETEAVVPRIIVRKRRLTEMNVAMFTGVLAIVIAAAVVLVLALL